MALRPERELSSASVAELSLVALSSNVAVVVSEVRRHCGGSGLTADGVIPVGASSARAGADMARVLCGVTVRTEGCVASKVKKGSPSHHACRKECRQMTACCRVRQFYNRKELKKLIVQRLQSSRAVNLNLVHPTLNPSTSVSSAPSMFSKRDLQPHVEVEQMSLMCTVDLRMCMCMCAHRAATTSRWSSGAARQPWPWWRR